MTPDNRLAIRIDDTGSVHLDESAEVNESLVKDLAVTLQDSGFFALAEVHEGISRNNTLEEYVIEVTLDRSTHRVRVSNRAEPSQFRSIREKLEDFGRVELGLWAVQYTPEDLIEMAHDAFLLGRKLYDERHVAHGNLTKAIHSFKNSEFYLKTIDPKPDFYRSMIEELSPACEKELDKRFISENFAATRANNLREWGDAAVHLRVILELIPDRSDSRNIDARRTLLEVEDRLRLER